MTSLLSKFVEELTSDHAAGEQVMVDDDAEALRQIAHRIKGTSANSMRSCCWRLRVS